MQFWTETVKIIQAQVINSLLFSLHTPALLLHHLQHLRDAQCKEVNEWWMWGNKCSKVVKGTQRSKEKCMILEVEHIVAHPILGQSWPSSFKFEIWWLGIFPFVDNVWMQGRSRRSGQSGFGRINNSPLLIIFMTVQNAISVLLTCEFKIIVVLFSIGLAHR